MTDDELRAEVERRGLLVIVEPDDPYVGNFPVEQPGRGRWVGIRDGSHAWAWKADLVEGTLGRTGSAGLTDERYCY